MRDRSHGLAMHDSRIDRAADIIHGHVPCEFDETRLGIDLDLADVRTIRPRYQIIVMMRFGDKRSRSR